MGIDAFVGFMIGLDSGVVELLSTSGAKHVIKPIMIRTGTVIIAIFPNKLRLPQNPSEDWVLG